MKQNVGMRPSFFCEDMEIKKITTAKLTGVHGIIVHSKKYNKDFTAGSLPFDFPLKEKDTAYVCIDFDRIHEIYPVNSPHTHKHRLLRR